MTQDFSNIPLPKAWPEHARSAIIHVISLAHTAIVCEGEPERRGCCRVTRKRWLRHSDDLLLESLVGLPEAIQDWIERFRLQAPLLERPAQYHVVTPQLAAQKAHRSAAPGSSPPILKAAAEPTNPQPSG